MKKAIMKAIEEVTTNHDPIEIRELKKQIQNPESPGDLVLCLKRLQEQKNIIHEKETFSFLIKEFLECQKQTSDKENCLFYLLSYWLLHIDNHNKVTVFFEIATHNNLLIALIDKNRLEFVRSLLEIIQYFSLTYKHDYLNISLNSYTVIKGDDSSVTPFMLASRKKNIDMILLLKGYGAIESLYQLDGKAIPETTAFQYVFYDNQFTNLQIKTAFYLWLNGAVMKLKMADYLHSPLSIPLSNSLNIISLLWLEYVLTYNQFVHIDNENLSKMIKVFRWSSNSQFTPYEDLFTMLGRIDKDSALYKKGQHILSLFVEKGADIDGIIPSVPKKSRQDYEFYLVRICAAGELKTVETHLQKEEKKINFFHYIDTPAFIAAIKASKQPELRDNALKILDLLYTHDSSCARYATRQGTMAVTQAALQSDRELLEKLILKYKLPVNPISAGHNPPVNELLKNLCELKISKQEFMENGFKDCLGLLIKHGSCVEQNITPIGSPSLPARQYILEQQIFDEKDSENLQSNTSLSISPKKLLLCPNLMSAIRAYPIQTFIYSRWLSDYMKIEAMKDQKFAAEQQDFIQNYIDHGIFSISNLCDLIGSYAATSMEEKHQEMSGPSFTFITEYYTEVKRKKEEEEKKREQELARSRPYDPDRVHGPGWAR